MDVATRYKLLEKIGAGSFATVYRAQDQELGREVAVKQIHAQFLAETSQFERYWKEATLLASFQHPHIVTIYDVVRGQGWLILELMQANIRDRLQGRPMDVKAVQTTLTQALRALSALHSRGLVHGDIKPSNLMIDHRKRVKVGDFGLARRVSHDDGSVIRGTAKYMAPETLSQEFGDVGPQSDLYSLGFTAYELMCGSKFETLFPGLDAFGRDRQAAWMMWHAAQDRKLPDPATALENVPPALAKVIGKLIEKDPKKRYETADQALLDLGSTPGEPMTRTAESGPVKKATIDKPKNRGLVVALFCVSMAASVAMLFWNPQRPTTNSPTAKLGGGVIRSVDPKTNTIEFIDPATGQPEELVVAEKTPIRLRAGGREELVLLKRLQPGDWIRSWTEEGRLKVDVSRPVSHEGRIAALDALGSKVTIAIEGPRVRETVTLTVPASVSPQLNGVKTPIRDLAIDDRVSVDHLLDPFGKQGEIASRLDAFRTVRSSGTVAGFDLAASTLAIASGTAYEAAQKFPLPQKASLTFDDGSPATVDDLTLGRPVEVTRDSVIRRLVLQRDLPEKKGMLVGVDLAGKKIRIHESGEESSLLLGDDLRVSLNDSAATLDDLRVNNDQVAVGLSSAGDDKRVETIRAVRMPRYDRAVIAIGASTNRDRSIPVIDHAIEQARVIREAAVQRFATPPEWAVILSEPTRDEVLTALRQRLEGLRPNSQAVVAIFAQAFVVDGMPILAFADYRPNEATATGLPLTDLLALIDAAPSAHKVLLLDVIHPRPGLEDVVPATVDLLLKDMPRSKSTIVLAAPPDALNKGVNEVEFGALVALGLQGAADADRDLTITPMEWIQFTTMGMGPRGISHWPK